MVRVIWPHLGVSWQPVVTVLHGVHEVFRWRGLTAEQRLRRKRVRMQPADRLAEGASDAQIAQEFRVSRMSANQWRRTPRPETS
ncbi:helix-turn-helix domain-containing protein [Microbispora rosea]|uniref:helix-turn-helix domain-containing protein n=1 Tax=Microbispora rosea TaxID=58117 RepID=UPI0037BA73F1